MMTTGNRPQPGGYQSWPFHGPGAGKGPDQRRLILSCADFTCCYPAPTAKS